VDGGSILWGRHRGAGMEGSAAVAAEDTVAGERCRLVWRDDKMPWGQPCPVAGTLLGVAKDHSLCDHFTHSSPCVTDGVCPMPSVILCLVGDARGCCGHCLDCGDAGPVALAT